MENSENIHKKLFKIQQNIVVEKNKHNDFGNYNYRSAEDILENLKKELKTLNCIIILSDDLVQIGENYYIKATAKLIDTESKEEIITTAYAREDKSLPKMHDSQVTGSTSSFARKYALNGLLALSEADSDDNNKGDKKQKNDTYNKTTNNRPDLGNLVDNLRNKSCTIEIINQTEEEYKKHSWTENQKIWFEKELGIAKTKLGIN